MGSKEALLASETKGKAHEEVSFFGRTHHEIQPHRGRRRSEADEARETEDVF